MFIQRLVSLLLFFCITSLNSMQYHIEREELSHYVYVRGFDTTQGHDIKIDRSLAKFSHTLMNLFNENPHLILFSGISHNVLEHITKALIGLCNSTTGTNFADLIALVLKISELDNGANKELLQLCIIDIILLRNERFGSEIAYLLKLLPLIRKISEQKALKLLLKIMETFSIQLPWDTIIHAFSYEYKSGLPYLFYVLANGKEARDVNKQITDYVRCRSEIDEKNYKDVILENFYQKMCKLCVEVSKEKISTIEFKTKIGEANILIQGDRFHIVFDNKPRIIVPIPITINQQNFNIRAEISCDKEKIAFSDISSFVVCSVKTGNIIRTFTNIIKYHLNAIHWLTDNETIFIELIESRDLNNVVIVSLNVNTGNIIEYDKTENTDYSYLSLIGSSPFGRYALALGATERKTDYFLYDSLKKNREHITTLCSPACYFQGGWSIDNEYLAIPKHVQYRQDETDVYDSLWKLDHTLTDYFDTLITIEEIMLLKNIAHVLNKNNKCELSIYEQRIFNDFGHGNKEVGDCMRQKLESMNVLFKKIIE